VFLTSVGWVLLTTLVIGDKIPKNPMLDKLAAEAETLKAEQPDRWKQYQQQTEGIFADNEKVLAHWKNRSNPPQPDLRPLKLPLVFLVDALRQEEKPRESPRPAKPVRGHDARRRHRAYLTAIVHSADERRIPALLEYRDYYLRLAPENKEFYSWGKLLADAATIKWATAQITELAKRDPSLDYTRRFENLLYCLIDRFACELPADSQKLAYPYIRKQVPDGPTGYESEQIWNVLFRLDASRARKEILAYFGKPNFASRRYNTYVIALLSRHLGPSPEVATAIHQWLTTQGDLTEFSKRQLRVILLRADPAKELEPTIKHIDRLLAEQIQKKERFELGGDVHMLVLAMGDVESNAADQSLARYVFERAIDTGVRFLILESLVRRRYAKSPELAARWLAEEPEHMQSHLKKEAAKNWGAFGRKLLEKAECLNAQKMP
jgi:hypothetical protein